MAFACHETDSPKATSLGRKLYYGDDRRSQAISVIILRMIFRPAFDGTRQRVRGKAGKAASARRPYKGENLGNTPDLGGYVTAIGYDRTLVGYRGAGAELEQAGSGIRGRASHVQLLSGNDRLVAVSTVKEAPGRCC